MIVAVGSRNPVKVAAVRAAFGAIDPSDGFSIECCDSPSGVSKQPMSHGETITGARNRAVGSREALHADFGIGIESGLEQIAGTWFTNGWIAIVDRQGSEGLACAIMKPVPLPAMRLVLDHGLELGVATDRVFGTKSSKHATGLIGLLTDDVLTREGTFRDAIIAAYARFRHPELF
ncbi:MAG: inosine/xanthosine triphosphatase [Chloroflexota bacterium]|nr:inosine/xanthosine triphosphatase [Chloroflexota bacterium]